MKIKQFLIAFFVLFTISKAFSQDKKFKIHTVAFYNFENLFDTINDPNTIDEEYLPNKGWTYKNYRKKLDNLSRVIIELGTDENPSNSPVVIGACEIENRRVLEDLVKHPTLVNKGYKIKWCLDHDHKTGKFRGYLCDNCNTAISKLQDDVTILENAGRYLSQ